MDQKTAAQRYSPPATGGENERSQSADRRALQGNCCHQSCLGGKGVLTQMELNGALKKAEAIAPSDERFVEDLNPSSRDAVCSPIRILEATNKEKTPRSSTFSDLARLVGETKEPYNDMY